MRHLFESPETVEEIERLVNRLSKIKGFSENDFLQNIRYNGPHPKFYEFCCQLEENLPDGCSAELTGGTQSITVYYRGQKVLKAYLTPSDNEIHYYDDEGKLRAKKMLGFPRDTALTFIKKFITPKIPAIEAEMNKKEEEKKRRASKIERLKGTIQPDSKDIMRANNAWDKALEIEAKTKPFMNPNKFREFVDLLFQQIRKIKDGEKYKRRVIAFYNKIMDNAEPENPQFVKAKRQLENHIADFVENDKDSEIAADVSESLWTYGSILTEDIAAEMHKDGFSDTEIKAAFWTQGIWEDIVNIDDPELNPNGEYIHWYDVENDLFTQEWYDNTVDMVYNWIRKNPGKNSDDFQNTDEYKKIKAELEKILNRS